MLQPLIVRETHTDRHHGRRTGQINALESSHLNAQPSKE